MTDLVIGAHHLDVLRTRLLGANVEGCAVLFANEVRTDDGSRRMLVRKAVFAEESDYSIRTLTRAELKPDFVARVTKDARIANASTVWVHSHPGSSEPTFSDIDDFGEVSLRLFLSQRVPSASHAALVISEGGVNCREIGSVRSVRVVEIGMDRIVHSPQSPAVAHDSTFDRQIRAFGAESQSDLSSLRVGIVGLGGTGSIVAEQLAHLGVRDFILVDPDVIELTNLNRVVGASPQTVGRSKVEVAASHIHSIAHEASVQAIQSDITRLSVAKTLTNCDFLFGCTDSHGSRSVIQQIAYQYLIPCIDMGSTIIVDSNQVRYVHGRTQLLAPTLACLTCSGLLDPAQVRIDLMSEFERRQDPYVQGIHEPAPSVISLNGTVSSLSISMMLAICTGFPVGGRHLLYDAQRALLRNIHVEPVAACYICSESGAYARGDTWPLFARNDSINAN